MHYPLAVVKARDVSVARAVQKKVQEKRNHWRRIASLSHEFRTLNTTDVYSNAAHIRPLRMEHMTTVVVEVMTTMSVSNGNSTRCTVLCFHLSRTTWNSIVFFFFLFFGRFLSIPRNERTNSLSLSFSLTTNYDAMANSIEMHTQWNNRCANKFAIDTIQWRNVEFKWDKPSDSVP